MLRRHKQFRQIYAQLQLDSAAARAATTCELDLSYGPEPAQRLDYFPAAHYEAPLFLFIHGGDWYAQDKRDFSFIAPPLVEAGIAVALINYALAPRASLEEIAEHSQEAIRWAHAHARVLGFDPSRLVVGGHGAGAHLAALAQAWRPRLPIAAGAVLSGIYDLVPLLRSSLNLPLALDEERARRLSPIYQRRPAGVPALIGVGGAETRSFRLQARAFAQHCGRVAMPYPDLDHFGVVAALGNRDSPVHFDVRAVIEGTGGPRE